MTNIAWIKVGLVANCIIKENFTKNNEQKVIRRKMLVELALLGCSLGHQLKKKIVQLRVWKRTWA